MDNSELISDKDGVRRRSRPRGWHLTREMGNEGAPCLNRHPLTRSAILAGGSFTVSNLLGMLMMGLPVAAAGVPTAPRVATEASAESTPGFLGGYGEPVLVFLLMLAAASVVVGLGRRLLSPGAGGSAMGRPGALDLASRRGAVPAMERGIPGGMNGGRDAHARIVPFPPSASEEPEWDTGGLRLGGSGAGGRRGGAGPSSADQEKPEPPVLEEVPVRGIVAPVLVAASAVASLTPVEGPGQRRIAPVPTAGEVPAAAAGTGGVKIPRPVAVSAVPGAAPEPSPAEKRAAAPRLKLTSSSVSKEPGHGAMSGPGRAS